MGIDIAKIKARLAATEGKEVKDSVFWRPEEGDQKIRLLPTEDGDPFKDFHFHYLTLDEGGQKRRQTVMCPKRNFGESCPICAFASDLWSNGDDEDKKLAKSLFVRQRFFSAVLVRGQEDQGVKVYGYGKTSYETFLNLVVDPDYGDITDVDEGIDFTLRYEKPSKPGAFPTTTLTPVPTRKPLAKSKKEVKDLLDSIPDFNSLYQRKSTVEVQEILDRLLATPDDSEGLSKYGPSDMPSDLDEAAAFLEKR